VRRGDGKEEALGDCRKAQDVETGFDHGTVVRRAGKRGGKMEG